MKASWAFVAASLCGAFAHASPQSAFDLGRELRSQDSERAFGLIEQAAKDGHAPAMFVLSSMLASGEGHMLDAAGSNAWLERAAKMDNPEAMQQLAMHYQHGTAGYARDAQRAASLLRRVEHALKHRHHGH